MADTDIPYDPAKIEEEIQSYWKEHETFSVTEDPKKEKFFCLSMFPHPRMDKRDFILKPLHDLSPYWTDPINGKPIKSLIYKCKRSNISIAKAI